MTEASPPSTTTPAKRETKNPKFGSILIWLKMKKMVKPLLIVRSINTKLD